MKRVHLGQRGGCADCSDIFAMGGFRAEIIVRIEPGMRSGSVRACEETGGIAEEFGAEEFAFFGDGGIDLVVAADALLAVEEDDAEIVVAATAAGRVTGIGWWGDGEGETELVVHEVPCGGAGESGEEEPWIGGGETAGAGELGELCGRVDVGEDGDADELEIGLIREEFPHLAHGAEDVSAAVRATGPEVGADGDSAGGGGGEGGGEAVLIESGEVGGD